MPIIKSAKKAMRQSASRKSVNDSRKRSMKDIIKKVIKFSKTDKTQAASLMSMAFKAIDKAAKKGVIKKNNASRKKSRLSRLVK